MAVDAKVIAIAGRKRAGKTTEAQRIVAAIGVKPVVYDVQRQWGPSGKLPPMKDFLAQVRKASNTIAVFEEAGIFFRQAGSPEDLLYLLTSARHSGVTTFLLFHSLRQLPMYVIDLLDKLILLKTNDTPRTVFDKFKGMDELIEAWEQVNADPDPHAKREVDF